MKSSNIGLYEHIKPVPEKKFLGVTMLSKSLGTFVRLLINIAKLPSRKAFPSHAIFVGCLMRLVWILHTYRGIFSWRSKDLAWFSLLWTHTSAPVCTHAHAGIMLCSKGPVSGRTTWYLPQPARGGREGVVPREGDLRAYPWMRGRCRAAGLPYPSISAGNLAPTVPLRVGILGTPPGGSTLPWTVAFLTQTMTAAWCWLFQSPGSSPGRQMLVIPSDLVCGGLCVKARNTWVSSGGNYYHSGSSYWAN